MNETLSVTDREKGGTCHFSSAQILPCRCSPPSSHPPLLLCCTSALRTPLGAHLKGFLSEKRFSLCMYKPLVISMPLHPSVSLSIVSWFRFAPVPRYICLCLETGGASSSAIRRGGLIELKCQQSGRGKSAFPLTLGVISGWNELASCQGNHLVASVVPRGRKRDNDIEKKGLLLPAD